MTRISRSARLTLLAAIALMAWACASRKLPDGVPPEKRDWYGEFYNPQEYTKCVERTNDRRNTQCEYLRLMREEEPEYWPYPYVPKPKLPEAPDPPVYRSGMTSKEYFDALCKAEAGEFIYRVVENVEGVYQIRPRRQASQDALMDRYVMEDPYGYTRWDATEPQKLFAGSGVYYRFLETPVIDPARQKRYAVDGSVKRYVRIERRLEGDRRTEIEEFSNSLKSRYGYSWRGIKRPFDREAGIAGGELVVLDLTTNEVLAIRRGFARTGFASGARGGINWESPEVCPRLRRQADGFDKWPEFTYSFVSKVVRPAK